MMGTKISWADKTWNPIIGCSKVSAGCASCYAERMACRLRCINPKSDYSEVISYKPMPAHWNGKTVFVESALTKPLHWRKPRTIFVNSMGDTFHESVPFEWIDRVFAVMALCPQHRFMCLTKRAGRMKEYIDSVRHDPRINHTIIAMDEKYTANMVRHPLPNVHLGVTVEDQDNVGRIADLIQTPAAKRFVLFEPLLGRIDIPAEYRENINHIYLGCESQGPPERLCSLADIQYIMAQCQVAGVKVHIKQLPLDGRCNKHIEQWPLEFQIREV